MESIHRLVEAITTRINALASPTTANVRAVRKEFSEKIKKWHASDVLQVALSLIHAGEDYRWVAYELVHFHKPALKSLGRAELERLGEGMDAWQKVDTFALLLSGVAWRQGQINDGVIQEWARSDDLWWRRAALVSTIALNTKARGGKGDVSRTLAVCEMLVSDPEDMVIKALSWALRELIPYDPEAVRDFVNCHEPDLAARVKREVRNKLETGLKNP